MTPHSSSPAGLIAERNGQPYAFVTLGAVFHLDPLAAEHEQNLERFNQLVLDWYGTELRWTTGSMAGATRRFQADDLEFVSVYPSNLTFQPKNARHELVEKHIQAAGLTDFCVHCYGAEERLCGSSFNYSFFADIPTVPKDTRFDTISAFKITVPVDCPPDVFSDKVRALADVLPLRWGAAGFMLAGSESAFTGFYQKAAYAYARRHPGCDIANEALFSSRFHDQIRTINWLTWIGHALLPRVKNLTRTKLVEVTPFASGMLLQAGAAPSLGDHNRTEVAEAYREADSLLRPLRARDEFDFLEPWDNDSTTQWLNRFER